MKASGCDRCGVPLREADFDAGRAVILLGRRYCDPCINRVVAAQKENEHRAALSPRPRALPELPEHVAPPPEDRRTTYRFVPPGEASLAVRRAGLSGLFAGNLVRFWIDVSEGGFRAILSRPLSTGESVQATLRFQGETFRIAAAVNHRAPSESHPGCFSTGLRFVDPSAPLRVFIRDVLGKVRAAPTSSGTHRRISSGMLAALPPPRENHPAVKGNREMGDGESGGS